VNTLALTLIVHVENSTAGKRKVVRIKKENILQPCRWVTHQGQKSVIKKNDNNENGDTHLRGYLKT
jgi:hypothetical protein